MSTQAYERAISRENKLWTIPFIYSYPFEAIQVIERGVIYGLYSGAYLNFHGYLIEIETYELTNLLADYNAKTADLTTKEANFVADIVSKRYLASIDKLIHNQKMVTKANGIAADDEMWTAKITALSADRAALATLAAKVVVETAKITARIQELEAYIQIEATHLSEVDIQIAEKTIQSAKVSLEILNAANAVLRIQTDTILAAAKLIDIDIQISRTRGDMAHTEVSMAKIDLLVNELERTKAQTTIMEGERDVASAKADLAIAKSTAMDGELEFYAGILPEQSNTDKESKLELMNQKDAFRRDNLGQRKDEKDLLKDSQRNDSNLGITFANEDAIEQVEIDAEKVSVMEWKTSDRRAKTEAAVRVAETLALANITTTLAHTVQKASTT